MVCYVPKGPIYSKLWNFHLDFYTLFCIWGIGEVPVGERDYNEFNNLWDHFCSVTRHDVRVYLKLGIYILQIRIFIYWSSFQDSEIDTLLSEDYSCTHISGYIEYNLLCRHFADGVCHKINAKMLKLCYYKKRCLTFVCNINFDINFVS